MIKEADIVKIGAVVKAAGTSDTDAIVTMKLPPLCDNVDAMSAIIMKLDGIFIPFFAKEFEIVGDYEDGVVYECHFENVSSADIRQMQKADLWVLNSDADHFEHYEDGAPQVVGYAVIADGVNIGVIDDIDTTTDNALLVVNSPSGEEYFIPAADDFIDDIDTENEIITMTLPDGLLKINSK